MASYVISCLRLFAPSALLVLFTYANVLAATIGVDGDPGDWPGDDACVIGSSGCPRVAADPNEGAIDDPFDVRDVYATNDDERLFLRFDTYGDTGYNADTQVVVCMDTDDDQVTGGDIERCNGDGSDQQGVDFILELTGASLQARLLSCADNVVLFENCTTVEGASVAAAHQSLTTEASVALSDLNISTANCIGCEIPSALFFDNGDVLVENDHVPDAGQFSVAINWKPRAQDDSVSTGHEESVSIDVLANDDDIDGSLDPATVTVKQPPGKGSATVNADGSITYTPDDGFGGEDSLSYTVKDDRGEESNEALVTVSVNSVPVADPQSVTTPEDTALDITLTGSDPDGDPLDYRIVSDPANGTLSGTPPTVTYTPAPDFNGADAFEFEVCDPQPVCDSALVDITVEAVNDSPVAQGDAYETTENASLSVASPGVLANDEDPDGDALLATLVSGPSSGQLDLNADGSFTYTPNPDFAGTDGFTYEAADGNGGADRAVVEITVATENDPPLADDQSVVTSQDQAVDITLTASDSDGDPLEFAVVSGPANGSLSGTAPEVSYQPDPGFVGDDAFEFEACDPEPQCDIGTVSINVQDVTEENSAPLADDQSVVTREDNPLEITLNASDPEGDPLEFVIISGPDNGALSGDAPEVTYTPDPDFNGADAFHFQVCDPEPACDSAVVEVMVEAVNDSPVVRDDSYQTTEEAALMVAAPGVLTNDDDPDGDALTAVLEQGTSNGTVALNDDGSFSYKPNAGFTGMDKFRYRADDGATASSKSLSEPANVAIEVRQASIVVTVAMSDPLGLGSVSSSPPGITCPEKCSAEFLKDSELTLVASEAGGGRFTGWQGCTRVEDKRCLLTVTGHMSVTAKFQSAAIPALGGWGILVLIACTALFAAEAARRQGRC